MHYLDMTIVEIHHALIEKKTTPIELVREAIRRAKEDTSNAFELILEQEAIKQAENLGEPERFNLLWGIPFVAKDNFSTKGYPTTASSNILNGFVPLYDATVITRLRELKAIMIGKATLDELAMGGSGTTGHRGPTYNPFDPLHERMIGGSSAGSAASVSAGIVPFALGSDTGDSVRKPASYAGLVGFKPTWGRISRYGLFPFAPSLDHVGVLARSVADATIVTMALSGYDPNDATSSTNPVPDDLHTVPSDVTGLRIAVIKEIVNSPHDRLIKQKFEQLTSELKTRGAQVDTVSMRRDLLDAIYPIYITLSCAEATSNNANLDGIKFGPATWGQTYSEAMMAARTKGFSELIKRRFIIGSYALMRENQGALFLRAQKGRGMIVAELKRILGQYDLILVPAAPSIAPRFIDKTDKLSEEYLIADNHLVLGNFAGLPSMTVPLGLKEGMPFGVNVMGKAFDERAVLKLALAVEEVTGLKNLMATGGDAK